MHINTIVIPQTIKGSMQRLWKSVENQESVADCCSGCAGDYEDPDRTAWEAEMEEVEEEQEIRAVQETPEGWGG